MGFGLCGAFGVWNLGLGVSDSAPRIVRLGFGSLVLDTRPLRLDLGMGRRLWSETRRAGSPGVALLVRILEGVFRTW